MRVIIEHIETEREDLKAAEGQTVELYHGGVGLAAIVGKWRTSAVQQVEETSDRIKLITRNTTYSAYKVPESGVLCISAPKKEER